MHDLNTINRLNLEAHGAAITKWQSEGRWVVAVYEGATLFGATPHDAERDARTVAASKEEASTGRRVVVLEPSPEFFATARDQSEDRPTQYTLEQLAALGASSPANPAPEGIVIFHSASGVSFKKTLHNDEKPKGQQ